MTDSKNDQHRQYVEQTIERCLMDFKPKTDYGEIVGGILGYLYAWRLALVVLVLGIIALTKL